MGNQPGSRGAPLAVEDNTGVATQERSLDREDAVHPAAAPRSGAVMPDMGFDRAPRSIEDLAALTCSSRGARGLMGFPKPYDGYLLIVSNQHYCSQLPSCVSIISYRVRDNLHGEDCEGYKLLSVIS